MLPKDDITAMQRVTIMCNVNTKKIIKNAVQNTIDNNVIFEVTSVCSSLSTPFSRQSTSRRKEGWGGEALPPLSRTLEKHKG